MIRAVIVLRCWVHCASVKNKDNCRSTKHGLFGTGAYILDPGFLVHEYALVVDSDYGRLFLDLLLIPLTSIVTDIGATPFRIDAREGNVSPGLPRGSINA